MANGTQPPPEQVPPQVPVTDDPKLPLTNPPPGREQDAPDDDE